jgi:two-component system, cell cycle sensor histidine kinase and response regulator CckA
VTAAESWPQVPDLEYQIEGMFRRFLELADEVGKVSDERSAGLLTEVLQELSAAVEELEVSTEEIQAQNEALELAQARVDLEAERFRELFDGAPDGYLVTDENGIILASNRVSTTLLGTPSRLLLSKPLIVYVHPDDRRTLLYVLTQVLREAAAECEVRFVPPKGTAFPASVRATCSPAKDGVPLTVRWLIRDVSQRVAAEAALAAEEERHRLVVDSISDIVVTTDQADRVTFVSPSLEKILGRPPADIEGNHISFIFEPDDWPALVALEERVRLQEPQARAVLRAVGLKGPVSVEVAVALLHGESGEPAGTCYTMRDVDEAEHTHVALQAALSRERQATDALREADAAKDALLLAASHDLSSPVAAVVALAQQLVAHPDLPDGELLRMAEGIASAGSQLHSILTNLLDAERVLGDHVVVHTRPTDLRDIVARSVREHGLPVSCITPPRGPFLVEVDPGLTARIVDNVVGNALRHTPAGTPIRVTLDSGLDEVTFGVADRGPGVPDDVKDVIFEPFRRQSTGVSGLGLGLFVVRRFAELQGGRCWVEDSEGGGATFRVTFPAAEREG